MTGDKNETRICWLSSGGKTSRRAMTLYSALDELQWRLEYNRALSVGGPANKLAFSLIEEVCSKAWQGFDALVDHIIESEEDRTPF